MKCLVTGGAGFIGSHIAEALLKRGDAVRILDDLSTGREENLRLLGSRIDFIRGDLRDKRDLARAVQGVDVVFHEDASRIRAGYAAENFVVLRHWARNLLQQNPVKRLSMHTRRLQAGCLRV